MALDELDGAVLTSDAARTPLCETMSVLDKNSTAEAVEARWQVLAGMSDGNVSITLEK